MREADVKARAREFLGLEEAMSDAIRQVTIRAGCRASAIATVSNAAQVA
jgi:hypothetical protein